MKTSEEIQQIIEQSSCEKRLSPQTSEEDKTKIIGYSKVSDLIKNVLNDQKYHQELIKSTHKQITNEINIDSEKQEIFHNLNSQFYKYKNYLNQIQKHEYFEIQPIFRTLDIDLQLIGQILNGKTLTDIIPNKPSIIIKTSLQSMTPIELQIHKDITLIHDNLSTIAMNMKNCQTIIHEKKILQDLLRIDINDRLQIIKNEYLEQKINEKNLQSIKLTMDKFVEFDQQQIEFINKLKDIYNMLNKESNKIQKNLLNITTARYHSNHPNFSLNAKLKYLPVDNSGNLIEQPLCLVDEHNMPISDELNLIRLPFESDRFHISNDKNEISLSEPITFKQLTLKSIEFEYVDDNRKTIQIIEISSHQSINKSIRLNVKTISFDKLPAKNNVNYLHIWNHLKIIFDEYEFINAYIQNRLDKLKIEEKIIELIIPILVLLNKLEIINEKNLQYDFLYSKFDRLYDILMNNYQINLPAKTNIEFIRDTLRNNKKESQERNARI
ncbi:unnamed protein product [Rotaria sp. Silwood1]|nr:unnamed protein product [Rotaria sp. Silwood1]